MAAAHATGALHRAQAALQGLSSGAQARTAAELLTGAAPRHALMAPALVPAGVALYLALKPLGARACAAAGTTGRSLPFRALALVHNVLLCAYSTWTAANVLPLTLAHVRERGFESAYCDHELWERGLGYWGFLFYLSKYWELFDTALLICKRRAPSYLQVYHHAMTIVCAYLLQASHASVMFLFVGLNASVHSIMYCYYALATLGIRFPAKAAITTMQMGQFVFGILATTPMFLFRDGACAIESQKIAVAAIVVHAAYLTYLFWLFYQASYKAKRKAS